MDQKNPRPEKNILNPRMRESQYQNLSLPTTKTLLHIQPLNQLDPFRTRNEPDSTPLADMKVLDVDFKTISRDCLRAEWRVRDDSLA